MRVRVSLHGDVHRFLKGRPDPLEVDLPEGATISDALDELAVDYPGQLTFGLNGNLAQRDASLREGDQVLVMTPMEGGS